MRYRRVFVEGGTYFFTVNLADRRISLLMDHVDILRNAIRKVKKRHPFHIDAIVILPDHLHALWTLPENDCDYPKRWMLIKMEFSRHIPKNEHISQSRVAKGERNIWQRRYWEHLIRDENDYARHVDYIHYNPVKHGHATRPSDWEFSSIHKYIAKGKLDPNWGSLPLNITNTVGWGERSEPQRTEQNRINTQVGVSEANPNAPNRIR